MNMPVKIAAGIMLVAAAAAAGCSTAVRQRSPSEDVKAFFIAANEANFLSAQQCVAPPHSLDLSAYGHLMDVKYPPTQRVEVLSGPPARPYHPFAVLEGVKSRAPRSSDGILIEGFKERARQIGADAIILCRPEEGSTASARMEAVAIKYRIEDRKNQP